MNDYGDDHELHAMECLSCTHEWTAVTPLDIDDVLLTCPECGHESGVGIYN